jgi:membrane protein implicated in regulation of membrane protease activity
VPSLHTPAGTWKRKSRNSEKLDMTFLFMLCAVVGGTILLCQVALTVFGLTGDAMDLDIDGDVDVDLSADVDSDISAEGSGGDADVGHAHAGGNFGSSWLFGALSFRTVVAAVTFFGLGGLAAQSTGASSLTVLLIACASGLGALYSVYWLMSSLYRLRAEGTVRIQRAVGREAVVYLAIPGHNTGAGKIHINLQNRTMEYRSVTSGDAIPTGARVVVTDVAASDTLKVQPALEPERIEHV